MSRVFRSEDTNIRSVWIPTLEFDAAQHDENDESGSVLVLEESPLEAAMLVESAKAQACKIIEEAKRKAAECHAEAKKSGFAKGYNEGFEEGLNQAERLLCQAQEVLEQSKTAFEQYLQQCEPYFLAMILEIAKKIVGESIQCDPDLALSMVQQAVSAVDDERNITIRVNPEIVAILEGTKQTLEGQYNRSVDVLVDPSISTGAVIESPRGQVDATIETQIRNIARAIGESRTRQHEHGAL